MINENTLPLNVEDRDRAIQIVGSTTRRFANAVGLYLIFALPSLVMGIAMLAWQFGDLHPMDPSEPSVQFGNLPELALTTLVACLPNLLLIWIMFRVQTNYGWRRLIVQPYFRRALQIVVVIRVVSWMCFMFLDALIGGLAIAIIALPTELIGDLFGYSNVGEESLGVAMFVLLPILVIAIHLFLWGLLLVIVSAITSVVMNQTTFPCLWCGHEQHPTVSERCPECGIALSEAEVSRAKLRRIYHPVASVGSAANDFENPAPNA